jgi:hypothetical protein
MAMIVRWRIADRLAWLVVAALALVLGRAEVARADDDFFSSSPGPLSRSHQALDTPDHCNDCHTGGRGLSNDKCLGCHDHADLKARIASGQGFHASAAVKGKQCEACHLEHKDKNYDLMGWRSLPGGQQQFDHKITGWALNGKHAATKCNDCHKRKDAQGLQTFLGEDKLCGTCHNKDQPHGYLRRAMQACERCHGESVWKPAKSPMDFDHNNARDAAMALVGSHADVSCAKCHPKSLFKLKFAQPEACGNCHKSPHDGQLFGKTACEQCHSPTMGALDKFQFDHDKRTKFPLGQAHNRMVCEKCHTRALGERKPTGACETCHAADNKHGDRFKAFGTPQPQCATCHTSTPKWVATVFAHDRRTRFKLTGRHAEVECRSCHRGRSPSEFERFDATTVGCMGCHQHKTVHDGQFKDKECLRCHQGAGRVDLTAKSVDQFHGPTSKFPLTKAHKFVKCAECHKDDNYKDTPMECGGRCHEDSLHKGKLGETCSRCHWGGTWEAVRFDHTEDTKWELKGMHKDIPDCADCHPKREYTGTPKNCGADGCHAKDDAHKGRLGNACETCHRETGDNIFNHNTMSRFKLDGKHLTTRCGDCHPSQTFKPRPTNCFGCHPEPEVHMGQYGTACERCHSTKDFGDIKPLHDVGDFSLTGQHDHLPCQRCHKDNRPLAGTGNLCMNCHRQDDVHNNSLSPRCGECHTQVSFAPARFDHATVGCNMTGLHRALACKDCHKTGNFGGLLPQCASCHRDDAVNHGGTHLTYTTCATCHSINAWNIGARTAGMGYGRESVCR